MNRTILIISYCALAIMLAAVGIGLRRYPRLDQGQRLLLLLTILTVGMEVCTRVLLYLDRPNLFLAPIDAAMEFTLLALLYRWALRSPRLRQLILWLIATFVGGTALSYTPRFDTTEFNSWQHTAEAGLLLALACAYLYQRTLRDLSPVPLLHDSVFWVAAGGLLYFSGSLLIFLSSNYVLRQSAELSRQLWALHGVLCTLLNACYAVALACAPRPGGPVVTQS